MSADFTLQLHDGAKVKVAVTVTPLNDEQAEAAPPARCTDLMNLLSGLLAGSAPRLITCSQIVNCSPHTDARRN